MTRSRLVFVLLSFTRDSPAGVERSVWNLVCALRELGHDALVLTAAMSRDDAVVEVSLPIQFPATEADLIRAMTPASVQTVRDAITRVDPDLVCWTDASWGLAWLREQIWRGPSVAMMHVPRHDDLGVDAYRGLPLIVPSDFVRRASSHLGFDTYVLHNAVAVRASTVASPRQSLPPSPRVRSLSRAAFGKGIEEAIRLRSVGAPLYDVAIAEASFEIVTAEQEIVQRSVRDAIGSARGVTQLPPVRWLSQESFLDEAAALLVTSVLPETFGMGAVEAQLRGCPVVAFDVGAHREVLADSAILVDLDDGFEGLWNAVEELLSAPERYTDLSRRGLENAERFHPQSIATRFVETFVADA